MDQDLVSIILLLISLSALVTLAIAYWLIMRQDGTILTVISSVVGGIVGYLVKRKKEVKEGEGK